MELNLGGKFAIVTGASRGLGAALCQGLAKEGVHLLLNYVSNTAKAESVAENLRQAYGVRVELFQADVTDEAQVEAMFAHAEAVFHRHPHILVNNAGICPVVDVVDMDYADWKRVMDINFNSAFLTCRTFARRCIAAKTGGRIVNVASQAAFNGSKRGKTHYASSKGAMVSFTISFAKEVARHGIFVNAVLPGMLDTDLTRETLEIPGEKEKYGAAITLGRIGELAEVATMVAFLASEQASYSTGGMFDITGGMLSR